MKMSRHDRKIFNQGKAAGYIDGYAKGLHDGNPFNLLAEAISKASKAFADMANNPDFKEIIRKANETPSLLAEGDSDDSISGDDTFESEDEEEQSEDYQESSYKGSDDCSE